MADLNMEASEKTGEERKEDQPALPGVVAGTTTLEPKDEEGETDQEEIVGLQDILKAQKDNEETARVLYGAQDDTVCTWPEGYKPRQPILWCKTCTPETPAGVCLGCSVHCHDGHDLLELYTKRKFRCDCGTTKFDGKRCALYEEKSALNEFNIYNHNFAGKFCVCEETYPGETNEDMVQCVLCEDWFHLSHLNVDLSASKWTAVIDGHNSLVCTECAGNCSFLGALENEGKSCFSSCIEDKKPPVEPLSLLIDWRNRMCKCDKCKIMMERAGCSYLLDEDDDIEKFEEENEEMAKSNEVNDNEVVNQLVNVAGRDVAVEVIRGYNELKQNLGAFFNEKAQSGAVITTADVTLFFDQIKRRRLNPEE